MTEAQKTALYRLAQISDRGLVLQARGHLRTACASLVKRGFAEWLGNDKWTGAFFKVTDAGRTALRK